MIAQNVTWTFSVHADSRKCSSEHIYRVTLAFVAYGSNDSSRTKSTIGENRLPEWQCASNPWCLSFLVCGHATHDAQPISLPSWWHLLILLSLFIYGVLGVACAQYLTHQTCMPYDLYIYRCLIHIHRWFFSVITSSPTNSSNGSPIKNKHKSPYHGIACMVSLVPHCLF